VRREKRKGERKIEATEEGEERKGGREKEEG